MSIRQGNHVIAGSGVKGLSMFDFKWSDHTISDMNWILSSNTWHSGNTYKKMYNHLIEDYTNGETTTETIGEYTVTFNLAPDGHKIVLAANEPAVTNVYNATGIAWYYIIDTTNKVFKLPKTNYAFDSGTTSEIGKYVEAGLPDITSTGLHGFKSNSGTVTGALVYGNTAASKFPSLASNNDWSYGNFNIKASNSNTIYGNSTTVQPPATKLLLYFYAEQFVGAGSSGSGGTVSISYDDEHERLVFNSEE